MKITEVNAHHLRHPLPSDAVIQTSQTALITRAMVRMEVRVPKGFGRGSSLTPKHRDSIESDTHTTMNGAAGPWALQMVGTSCRLNAALDKGRDS